MKVSTGWLRTAALQEERGHCDVAVLTRAEKGSVVLTDSEIHILDAEAVDAVDAEAVDKVVDATGAGDLYAAGFLFGYTQGLGLARAGRVAALAAAEVIGHMGARPEVPLAARVGEKLGMA